MDSDYAVLKKTMTDDSVASFVRALADHSDGLPDLEDHFSRLAKQKSLNQKQLKANVFTNYSYFIDTGKEMKKVDNETKNIRHLLSDQSEMLSNLSKVLNDVSKSDVFSAEFESSTNSVNSRLTTEISGIDLPNNKKRTLLSENTVHEIDLHTGRPRQELRLFLLSDGVLTARPNPSRLSPYPLMGVEFYPFNSFSLEDKSNSAQWSKNVVRAIVYPEPLLLQFGSSGELAQWYELFNQTKKRAQVDQGALSKRKSSIIEARLSSNVDQESSSSSSATELFIYDIPAHLDVAIALKDYEACFSYLQQAETFFCENQNMMEAPMSNPNSPMGKLFASIQEKKKLLIKTLRDELSMNLDDQEKELFTSPERLVNLPGNFGKRSNQLKAAIALARLGYTNEVGHLFLKSVSLNMMQTLQQKLQLSVESVSSISANVFTTISLVLADYQQLFMHKPSMFACFSVWTNEQICTFCSEIRLHFTRNNFVHDLAKVSDLVQTLKVQSKLLQNSGLDVTLALTDGIEPLIVEATQQLKSFVEKTLETKGLESKNWECVTFEGSDQSDQLMVFLKGMEDIGIDMLGLVNDNSLAISPISITFYRILMPVCEQLGSLSTFGDSSINSLALQALVNRYIDTLAAKVVSLADEEEDEKNLVLLQLEFFADNVLPVVQEKFERNSERVEISFTYEIVRISNITSNAVGEDEIDDEFEDPRKRSRSYAMTIRNSNFNIDEDAE